MTDFIFEGFEPTPEIKSLAKELLWSLENQAPSQSRPNALIKQISEDQYVGNISFTSQQITLSAEINDSNPHKVLEQLKFQLKADIKKWRDSRFQSA